MSDSSIEAICADFQEACRKGEKPNLKDWLTKVPSDQQAELYRSLLELHVIWNPDEVPTKSMEHYMTEFPDFSAETVRVFDELSKSTQAWKPSPNSPLKLGVGNFRLLQVIGKGGMGTVWLAEREGPIQQRVAIKLIKDLDNYEEKRKRFDIERQALSLMNHINIARVVDLGSTDGGTPYFAMEYVPGLPLTTYCNRNGLNLNERLLLFCQICDGVQHAHQKGIIHRDLKPQNIIVTEIDGKPVPKIIDFGLAKAIGGVGRLVNHSLHTSLGQVVGSYLYMSPEQASGETLDIDTRSDIYSLGVILYELLTNKTPIEASSIAEKAVHKVLELIQDEEPPPPSRKLQTNTVVGSSTISEKRGIEPKELRRALRSELDWIVMKSLEKNRSRRYESATSFSEDIRRYLRNEPVLARPPSFSYILSKFLRRHQPAVTVASLLMIASTIAVLSLLWSWMKTHRANLEKIAALEEVEATANFWLGILQESSATDKNAEISLQDTLNVAARRTIQDEKISDNLRAKYYSVLNTSLQSDREESLSAEIESRMRSLLIHSTNLSKKSRLLLQCEIAAIDWGRNERQKSLEVYEEAVPKLAAILKPDDVEFLIAKQNLGYMRIDMGQNERGQQLLQEVLETPSENPEVISILVVARKTYILTFSTDDDQKLSALKTLLKSAEEKLGKKHPQTLDIVQTIGSSSKSKEVVLDYLSRALSGYEEIYGRYHPTTHFTRVEYTSACFNAGRYDLILPPLENLFEYYRRKKADLSAERFNAQFGSQVPIFQSAYVFFCTDTNRLTEAQTFLESWIDDAVKTAEPSELFIPRWHSLRIQLASGRLEEAEKSLAQLEAMQKSASTDRYKLEPLAAHLKALRAIQQLRTLRESSTDSTLAEVRLSEELKVLEIIREKQDPNASSQAIHDSIGRELAKALAAGYSLLNQPEISEQWRKKSEK